VRRNFNSNLRGFALKIGMSANYEKCVPENNKELLYWQILTSIVKFGEYVRKPIQPFRDLGF
jgi:hypothetical protein